GVQQIQATSISQSGVSGLPLGFGGHDL
ncbi:MAG: hypothetical protein EZS28_046725, partial [Streblomastix strix]